MDGPPRFGLCLEPEEGLAFTFPAASIRSDGLGFLSLPGLAPGRVHGPARVLFQAEIDWKTRLGNLTLFLLIHAALLFPLVMDYLRIITTTWVTSGLQRFIPVWLKKFPCPGITSPPFFGAPTHPPFPTAPSGGVIQSPAHRLFLWAWWTWSVFPAVLSTFGYCSRSLSFFSPPS